MIRKTVLVTGGAGYIGSHACKALHRAGYVPVVVDNLSRGHRENVKWGELIEADIADHKRVANAIRNHKPVGCLHFAAYAYVAESCKIPGSYYENNVAGSISLFNQLMQSGVRHIVFSSSCATYGEPKTIPITEETPQAPVNPYGRTKLQIEQMLSDFSKYAQLNAVILRYFNAAGADLDGDIGEGHDPEPHLIPRILMAAAGRLEAIDVLGTDYDTPDGSAVRDYIHVADLARAHVNALEYLLQGGQSDAFNLGTGSGHSVKQIIARAEAVTQRKIAVREGPRRLGDPAVLIANVSKAQRLLKFAAQNSSIDEIISSAWNWHCSRWGIL